MRRCPLPGRRQDKQSQGRRPYPCKPPQVVAGAIAGHSVSAAYGLSYASYFCLAAPGSSFKPCCAWWTRPLHSERDKAIAGGRHSKPSVVSQHTCLADIWRRGDGGGESTSEVLLGSLRKKLRQCCT
eukprot:1104911-Amphidinium_carterae.3